MVIKRKKNNYKSLRKFKETKQQYIYIHPKPQFKKIPYDVVKYHILPFIPGKFPRYICRESLFLKITLYHGYFKNCANPGCDDDFCGTYERKYAFDVYFKIFYRKENLPNIKKLISQRDNEHYYNTKNNNSAKIIKTVLRSKSKRKFYFPYIIYVTNKNFNERGYRVILMKGWNFVKHKNNNLLKYVRTGKEKYLN
jgi:hypothetical protein